MSRPAPCDRTSMSHDPVLPGFYPDPSVCRAGGDFVMVTSSFEYFPGVPVFTSRDLVSWQQVGNVLERESQLDVRSGADGASGGIFAPTVRHHAGRFWLATTNVHQIRRGHLLVHADDPAGPWSDPVYTEGLVGIDPDLSWDDEGVCRLTWSDVVRGGISQASVDPYTGQVLSEPATLWRGTGGAHVEGPHVVRRGDWWYLFVAEGGTHTGHMVTVARGRSIDGPFERNPANPVLTHRSLDHPVQSTGHADVVELVDGSWAMVHLGTRPRGSFPRWHVNGRETFLVGLDWVDDWPVVVEDRFDVPVHDTSFVDEFRGDRLHGRWIAPGVDPASFCTTGPGGLTLGAGRGEGERDAVRLLGVRARDPGWTAQVDATGDVALVLRLDDAHQVMVQRVGDVVSARVVIGPLDQVVAATPCPATPVLEIRTREVPAQPGRQGGPDQVVLGYDSGEFHELAVIDGRYLSTEVAGGFTGRVVGVEALGEQVRVSRFSYTATSGRS